MFDTEWFITYSWFWWLMYVWNWRMQEYLRAIANILYCGKALEVNSKYSNAAYVSFVFEPIYDEFKENVFSTLDTWWDPGFVLSLSWLPPAWIGYTGASIAYMFTFQGWAKEWNSALWKGEALFTEDGTPIPASDDGHDSGNSDTANDENEGEL